ncbi:unnamed protein product [Pleuronectes platessa]|uniref:Uncharacterized protein n=1 Tax=Pleuronectes platessa TaxID=8262 RepID=A0A9N7Y293_PLEPL|nr:unnamed protein product [Pleuronectes platessa]
MQNDTVLPREAWGRREGLEMEQDDNSENERDALTRRGPAAEKNAAGDGPGQTDTGHNRNIYRTFRSRTRSGTSPLVVEKRFGACETRSRGQRCCRASGLMTSAPLCGGRLLHTRRASAKANSNFEATTERARKGEIKEKEALPQLKVKSPGPPADSHTAGRQDHRARAQQVTRGL